MNTFSFPQEIKIDNLGVVYGTGMPGDNPKLGVNDITVSWEARRSEVDYNAFSIVLERATELFSNLSYTGNPYYLYIDELEAVYGDTSMLKRDLTMIRDLILSVKWFNSICRTFGYDKIYAICTLRTEVVNSIYRNIPPKEINKITEGYEVELKWNYANTNSFNHPIFKIWINRIKLSENKLGIYHSDKEIFDNWFIPNLHGVTTTNYILNNSWNKPRDIVRMLTSINNSINANRSIYDQVVLESFYKQYSIKSWEEIVEELSVIYNPDEILSIEQFLRGFKDEFSLAEAQSRLASQNNTFIKNNISDVFTTLYRIGVIGNHKRFYRWQHKGDEGVIIDNEWRFQVHPGLWGNFTIIVKGNKRTEILDENLRYIGEIVNAIVCTHNKALDAVDVEFMINEQDYKGYIHRLKTPHRSIRQYSAGDELECKVISYHPQFNKWILSLID